MKIEKYRIRVKTERRTDKKVTEIGCFYVEGIFETLYDARIQLYRIDRMTREQSEERALKQINVPLQENDYIKNTEVFKRYSNVTEYRIIPVYLELGP